MLLIYVGSLFMLILLSVISGDIHYISLPGIIGLSVLNLLGYLAWHAGERDPEDQKKRTLKR